MDGIDGVVAHDQPEVAEGDDRNLLRVLAFGPLVATCVWSVVAVASGSNVEWDFIFAISLFVGAFLISLVWLVVVAAYVMECVRSRTMPGGWLMHIGALVLTPLLGLGTLAFANSDIPRDIRFELRDGELMRFADDVRETDAENWRD